MIYIEPHDRSTVPGVCLLSPGETITPPERLTAFVTKMLKHLFSIRRGRGLGRCDQWMQHVRLFMYHTLLLTYRI